MTLETTLPPQLCIVVPCYNEEDVLPETCSRFTQFLETLSASGEVSSDSYVLFVDDGSKDQTWRLVEEYASASKWLRGLKLSRNRGHQNAVLAGLLEAEGDLLVSIDADLQDDVTVITDMVKSVRDENAEIVYGVRSDRTSDSAFKRLTAEGFYKFLTMLGVEIVFNHADFRMMTRKAVEAFREFEEVNLFLRGMAPLVGFKATTVEYVRTERFAGESKYPVRKMISLAWEGVTSLSIRPLRLIVAFGLLVSAFAFIAGIGAILLRLAGFGIAGWTSVIVSIYFLGGVQLISTGLIGEYVGKLYLEAKRRPRYIVEQMTNSKDQKS